MNNLKEIKIMHIVSLLVFIWLCGFWAGLFGWFIAIQFVIPDDWIF